MVKQGSVHGVHGSVAGSGGSVVENDCNTKTPHHHHHHHQSFLCLLILCCTIRQVGYFASPFQESRPRAQDREQPLWATWWVCEPGSPYPTLTGVRCWQCSHQWLRSQVTPPNCSAKACWQGGGRERRKRKQAPPIISLRLDSLRL